LSPRIVDSYITEMALPKEIISGYVKWDKSFHPIKVSTLAEADIVFLNALNVDSAFWKGYDPQSGRLEIDGKELEVEGFFGFRALYNVIPGEERTLSFRVQVGFEDGVVEEKLLETKIVRPTLEIVEPPPEVYMESSNSRPNPPLVVLTNKGSADIVYESLRAVVKTVESPTLKIRGTSIESDLDLEDRPFGHVKQFKSLVSITGKGYGAILVSFEYSDYMGNKYETPVAKVLVTIKERATIDLPMGGAVNESQPFAVVEPIAA
jgi:hypothetical protein